MIWATSISILVCWNHSTTPSARGCHYVAGTFCNPCLRVGHNSSSCRGPIRTEYTIIEHPVPQRIDPLSCLNLMFSGANQLRSETVESSVALSLASHLINDIPTCDLCRDSIGFLLSDKLRFVRDSGGDWLTGNRRPLPL